MRRFRIAAAVALHTMWTDSFNETLADAVSAVRVDLFDLGQ